MSVERALLALNDFMRFDSKGESTLLSKGDLGHALVAVFTTSQVDPVFAKTIASRFGGRTASAFVNMVSHDRLCHRIAETLRQRIGSPTNIAISRGTPRPAPNTIVFDAPRTES